MPIRYLVIPDAAGTTYTLTSDSGSFALTGTAATPKFNRAATAASGSFALSGTAATLNSNKALTAASGTFALTGTAASLVYGVTYSLSAASGSFAYTGTAAVLSRPARILALDSGSITLSGTAATLTYAQGQRTLAANSGAFALTGASSAGTFLKQIDIDYLLWYMQENLMIPTTAQIAAEVWSTATRTLSTTGNTDIAAATLAAAQTTPIHSDVKKVTSVTITGTGTALDPWGP